MGAPALALAAGSSIIQGVGSIQSGDAAAASAKYQAGVALANQQIAVQNSAYATSAGRVQEDASRMQEGSILGQQRAIQAGSGFDVNTGSAANVRLGTMDVANLNAAAIRTNAARESYGYRAQAMGFGAQSQLDTQQAGYDRTAGILGAIGNIAGGASSVASKWSTYFTPPPTSGGQGG